MRRAGLNGLLKSGDNRVTVGCDMEGFYYLVFLIAIMVIIQWYIANDAVKPDEPTRGLLAMSESRKKQKRKIGRPR